MRAKVLERDMHMCQRCGGRATEVDHITSLANGGATVMANLQSLCEPCHKKKTNGEDRRPGGVKKSGRPGPA